MTPAAAPQSCNVALARYLEHEADRAAYAGWRRQLDRLATVDPFLEAAGW